MGHYHNPVYDISSNLTVSSRQISQGIFGVHLIGRLGTKVSPCGQCSNRIGLVKLMVLSGKGSYRQEQSEKSVQILVFSRAATFSFVDKK